LVGGLLRAVQRLPILSGSVISPRFIARLIKGCRGDAVPDSSILEMIQHFQRSNEHFSRPGALAGAVMLPANRRAKCPS
jgi:hypothetical protein